MGKKTALGPWRGIDNVHRASALDFQIPSWKEKDHASVVTASDVDINDDGWIISRKPTLLDKTLADGLGGWEILGRMFFQDGSVLYERTDTDTDTALVMGLVDRVSLCDHNCLIYGSDGTTHFEIEGSTVRTWGLPVPTFSVSPVSGTVAAGTYRVQLSFSDARGNEGAVCDSTAITLSAAGAILVTLGVGDVSGATHVNVYVGRDQQPETSFVAQVAIGAMPYTVTNTSVTAGDIPITRYMQGPPTGIVGAVSWRAYLLVWRDNIVFRSEPQEPHLFDPHNNMPFSCTVQGVEGVTGGLWVATTKGMVWVAGESPEQVTPTQKSNAAVFKGSALVPGSKLGFVQSNELVALFVSTEGLLLCMPDGTLLRPTETRYHFDVADRVSITYSEQDNLRQILIAIVEN